MYGSFSMLDGIIASLFSLNPCKLNILYGLFIYELKKEESQTCF